MRRQRRLTVIVTAILTALVVFSGCGSDKKEGAPDPTATASPEGNLQSTIQSITTGTASVVTFILVDEKGAPLDPTTAGVSARFTIARINSDGNYENYIKSSTAGQPGFDTGGTFATVGNGIYTYTLATNITDTTKTLGGIVLDATTAALTHTVAAQIQRTITSAVGTSFQQAVNPYLNFRPDNGTVTVTREVVSISACNGCHGKLNAHGGGRREIALCILCHNPGPLDPETGQFIAMKSLIHKIHMGENLPSNEAGGDFTIIGFNNSVNSYKTVAFPFISGDSFITATPIECVKCHVAGKDLVGRDYGKDVDKWKNSPTREKCTTCHDMITFDSTVTSVTLTTLVSNLVTTITSTAVTAHTGGDQFNDNDCALCHPATGSNDYSDVTLSGAPVPSAHLILEKSAVFTGINFQILSVSNATPGSAPTVTFKVTDNAGAVISAATSSFNLKLGYFAQTDYVNNGMVAYGQPLTQSLGGAVANPDGSSTMTFGSAIPASATGTGVIGLEGRKSYAVTTPHKGSQNFNVGGKAVQYYFDLETGAQVTDPGKQRRRVVDVDKCIGCHSRLSLHGANRVNSIEECVICHNPNATDKGQRPADPAATPDGLAERPIDFKVMIHSIHTGENLELSKPYVIYGFGGSVNDFSEVRYPRDRRDCLACHIDATPKTFGLPLPAGVLGTTISTGTTTNDDADNTRTLPTKAVCTSCHDTQIAVDHADSRVVSGAETCTQCHTTGLLLGPDFAHTPVR